MTDEPRTPGSRAVPRPKIVDTGPFDQSYEQSVRPSSSADSAQTQPTVTGGTISGPTVRAGSIHAQTSTGTSGGGTTPPRPPAPPTGSDGPERKAGQHTDKLTVYGIAVDEWTSDETGFLRPLVYTMSLMNASDTVRMSMRDVVLDPDERIPQVGDTYEVETF